MAKVKPKADAPSTPSKAPKARTPAAPAASGPMAAINQHLGFDATPEDIRKILDAAKYEGQLTRDKLIEIGRAHV